nr:PEGA domain-containing protein [Deltaproteobacteria bacterium]
HLDTHLPQVIVAPSPAPRSGGGLSWAVVGIGMVAAAALVLGLVQLGRSDSSGAPAPASAVPPVASPPPATNPATLGVLVVRTTPSDATVLVDGMPVSGRSPYVVRGLGPGSHRLEVVREGFLACDWTVEGGADSELSVELSRRDVVLLLTADPPTTELRLWADDVAIDIGGDGDRHAVRWETGVRYRVEGAAPGYISRMVELVPSSQADQQVHLTLVRDPEATPAGVAERPSAKQSSGSSLPELDDLFGSSGGGRSTGRDPSEGRSPELLDPFASRPRKSGSADSLPPEVFSSKAVLRIGTSSGAAPARIYIDGRFVGVSPLMKKSVEPGLHKVRWEWSDSTKQEQMVKVKAGRTQTLRAG